MFEVLSRLMGSRSIILYHTVSFLPFRPAYTEFLRQTPTSRFEGNVTYRLSDQSPSSYAAGWTSIVVSCRGASMRKPAGGSKAADGRFRTWMFLTTVLVVINALVTLSGEDVAGIRGLILELCSSGIPSFELSAESAGLRPLSLEATSSWKFDSSRAPGAS